MGEGYAVYFFPQALEALGEAIRPYLQDGPAGPHVLCHGVDTGGSLVEMTLRGKDNAGTAVELELMVPGGMVRMIVSAHSDEVFGFGPRQQGVRMDGTNQNAAAAVSTPASDGKLPVPDAAIGAPGLVARRE